MRKKFTTLNGFGVALALLLLSVFNVNACDPNCGLSNEGSLSGTTSICAGVQATYTFSGSACLYSGCTIQKYIKVYSGSTLVYSSTLSTSNTHYFTAQSSGTYYVYGYLKANGYSTYCGTNSVCLVVKSTPATPTGACSNITTCAGNSFTLSATPASGTSLRWYEGSTLLGTGNSISHSEASAGTYTYNAYSYNSTTGCTSINSLSVTATISAGPTNLAISAPSTASVGQAISVSGSATGTGLTYSWNFGSGASPATGTGAGPISVTYSSLGSKTITLTVTDCYGCVSTTTKTVNTCGQAVINSNSSACVSSNIQFTATNAGSNSVYTWNFGSGATPSTASGIGPHNVSYSTTGNKTVSLTVTNSTAASCTSTVTKAVSITTQPTGLAINSNSTVFVNEPLTVSGSAAGAGNTLTWNFGSNATVTDGSSSSVEIHDNWTYSTGNACAGTYSFTNTAGSNRVLILMVGMEHGSDANLTSVTYGGKPLTQAVEKSVVTNSPSYDRIEIWYLKEADLATVGTGSKSFNFTWSSNPDYVMFSAAVFKNVNQTTPIGSSGTNEGTSNPMYCSSTLTCYSKDMLIVGGICGNEGSYSATGCNSGSNFTNSATNTFACFHKSITTSGSENPYITFNNTVNRQGIACLILNSEGSGDKIVTYSTVGQKTITLIVTNSSGCSDTITKVINVCGKAIINNTTTNCTNSAVQFSATDMGSTSIYNWNFGTGASPATASGKGPHNVVYSTSGSKTVSLTVTNSSMATCSSVVTKTVTINSQPTGLAINSNSTVLVNDPLTVTGTATGTGNTFTWDFGSGSTVTNGSTSAVALHNNWAYANGSYCPGTFSFSNTSGSNRILILVVGMEHGSEANLTAVTYGGKSLTQAVEKSITTNAPSYNRIEIWYLKESDLAAAGTGSKAFDFTWSCDPDYLQVSAAVFKNVDQTSPISSSGSAEGSSNPLYFGSGLSVNTNDMVVIGADCGNEGTYSLSGYTKGTDFTNDYTTTSAAFYKSITGAGTENPGITFSGTVNRQGMAGVVLKSINNGDKIVTYSTVGQKTITLIVTNSSGCSDTITKIIKVCGKAEMNCPTNNCTNVVTQFTATAQGGNSVYTWNFGSGASPATATGIGPHNVIYTTSGTKTATLTVTNSDMTVCNEVATRTLTIVDGPSALISGPTSGLINTNYTFTTTTVSGATYSWNVPSDGIVVSGAGTASIVVKWPSNGSKTISVTVTKNGCTATDNHTIEFTSCPDAVINPVSNICKSIPQTFSTVNQGSGVTYSWNFGSGATPGTASTIGPHSVTYSSTGSKTATITVSKSGCTTKTASTTFTVSAALGTLSLTLPNIDIFIDTALTYTVTNISGATYNWTASGGGIITGSGNTVQIKFPTAGSQTVSVTATKDGCQVSASANITVKTPICSGIKLNHTQVALKTSMKNYKFTHVSGNWIKFRKPTTSSDSFHTSRKFQRNGDTAISWQELSTTATSTATISFNRSASDLAFTIRDIDMPTAGANEFVNIKAYLGGDLIPTSSIAFTYNSTYIQLTQNSGTDITFKGLSEVAQSTTNGDLGIKFNSKVDSVKITLTNLNYNCGAALVGVGLSKMSWCITQPLPVSWLAVKAIKNNHGGVNVNWATASELNNDYFTIEKSLNNSQFTSIGTVKGAGTKLSMSKYMFEDPNASSGTVYYRIKQTDYNGDFAYSGVVVVNTDKLLNNVTLTPNPASTVATLTWDANIKEELTYQLTDLTGVVLSTEILPVNNTIHYMNLENLSSGIYLVNILSRNEMVYRSKIVVVR